MPLHRLPLEGKQINMKSTFSLSLALPSSLTLAGITFAALRSRVPITDTLVPLCKEFVDWDVILIDICFDLGEVPREKRVQFEQACGVYFERLERGSRCPLRGASPCNNGSDTEFIIGPLCRFNLVEVNMRGRRMACMSHIVIYEI